MSYHHDSRVGFVVPPPLEGFSDDAIKAMQDNPSYFAAWYTAKSLLLVAAIAYIAYQTGRARSAREQRSGT